MLQPYVTPLFVFFFFTDFGHIVHVTILATAEKLKNFQGLLDILWIDYRRRMVSIFRWWTWYTIKVLILNYIYLSFCIFYVLASHVYI